MPDVPWIARRSLLCRCSLHRLCKGYVTGVRYLKPNGDCICRCHR